MVAARAAVWSLTPLLMLGALAVQLADPTTEPVTVTTVMTAGAYLVALLAPYVVGLVLTLRVPSHGAGWSFLGLATVLAWSAFVDEYAAAALSGKPDLPGATLMATLSDSSFVGWFVFLTLCLHYTAAVANPRLRRLPAVTLTAAGAYQVCVMLRSTSLQDPYEGLVSPWAVPAIAGPAKVISAGMVILLGLCLLASVYELFSAFRRAQGETRQQLLWLVAGAVPLGPAVIASFAVSYAGYDWVAGPILAFCVTTLSLGAGLSVARYRLYDVERVVTDSTAYALSSGAVVAAFGLVVLVITRTVPVGASSPLSTVLATLAAAGVARPAYVWARNRVDRRFNRRRFDAVRMVEAGLAEPSPDVEALLREALGDPDATLVFAAEPGWVTADGRTAEAGNRAVDIRRRGTVTARLRYDPSRTEAGVVAAVAACAAAEIDNLGLRAELARQVEEVTESRARLATAHLDERRRMERDLHDGAQQRLLALALQLQSARVNDDDAVVRAEIDRAVVELGATVQDLRALASGLQPAALAGGGLRAATEDLAGRIPLRIRRDVTDRRYSSTLESAAWFVIAEGVANAVKHAQVSEVTIRAQQEGDDLHVVVADDGMGGADPEGTGLQGLADRVAALGGELSVRPGRHGGTHLEAVFPCGS
jgi:signal transduction histidine kinase